MARPRAGATPADRLQPILDRPVTAPVVRVKKLENEIEKAVTKRMSERLGVDASSIPAQLKPVIASAAASAAARAIELSVVSDAEEAVGDVTRGSLLSKFDARVDLARKGIDHIVGSSDVARRMKQRAPMLAAKKKALVDAGFSSEEAMEILLADIAARGH